jgi:hypothetical protein
MTYEEYQILGALAGWQKCDYCKRVYQTPYLETRQGMCGWPEEACHMAPNSWWRKYDEGQTRLERNQVYWKWLKSADRTKRLNKLFEHEAERRKRLGIQA